MGWVVCSCQLVAAPNTNPIFCTWPQVSVAEGWRSQVKMEVGRRKTRTHKKTKSSRNPVLHNSKWLFPNKLHFSTLTYFIAQLMLLACQSSASCTQLLLHAPAQQWWASAKGMFDISGDSDAAGMAKQLSSCFFPQLLHILWCTPQTALMNTIRWNYI